MNEDATRDVIIPSNKGRNAIIIGIIGMVLHALSYPIGFLSGELAWNLMLVPPALCGIPAIVLGGMGLKEAKKWDKEKEYALIGLFTGIVCWFIFPIIAMHTIGKLLGYPV